MNQRHLLFLFPSLLFLLFVRCGGTKKTVYNIPDSIPKAQRDELLAKAEKGKELFKANCSGCHGIFSNGKDGVPNFTSQQIDNYSARFLRHDPKNHAVTKEMSPDQMNDVLMFLRFRKVEKPPTTVPAAKSN